MLVLSTVSVVLHLVAQIILIGKILITKSCFGISGKAQILLAVAYAFKYYKIVFDFTHYFDNDFLFRLLYLQQVIACCLICLIFRRTYDRVRDKYSLGFLFVVMAFVVIITNDDIRLSEFYKLYSVYLEYVAMMPQFRFTIRLGEIEISMICYMIVLAFSSLFDIAHYAVEYESPSTAVYISNYGMEFILYFVYALIMWRRNVKISSKESQVKLDNNSDNNLPTNGEDPGNKEVDSHFYEPNLKECLLTLDVDHLKEYKDTKPILLDYDVDHLNKQNTCNTLVGVHTIKTIDDSTVKSSTLSN